MPKREVDDRFKKFGTVSFTAITKTSIVHAEFITALNPLILLPLGALLFGEHPNWRALRWGAVSIVGVALVLFFGPAQGASSIEGDLLVIVVICLWSGYLLSTKRARASGVGTLDGGLFGVYLGTAPDRRSRARRALLDELRRLKEEPVSVRELHRAKKAKFDHSSFILPGHRFTLDSAAFGYSCHLGL